MPRPDTRARLLDAAEALSQDGELPSVDAICARAGVSRATLYRHFGDKAGLATALTEDRGVALEPTADVKASAIAAALEVFTAEGFGAPMERIAEVAGLGPATLYRHFGDKDGLIRAFVEAHNTSRDFAALQLGGKDPRADLQQIAALMLRFVHGNQGLLRLALSPDSAPLQRALNARSERTRDRVKAMLAAWVDRGVLSGDPALLTYSFMSLVVGHGALFSGFLGLDAEAFDPERSAAHLVQLFLEGARAR